jgi:hypothetical protein
MMRRNWMRIVAVALLVVAGLACDEEALLEPPENEEPVDTLRDSTTSLIEQYFPDAYSRMDSAAYEEALDASYQFQLLPEDVDPDDPDQDWWDKSVEMTVAGNMFHARANDEGQEVKLIRLFLDEKLTVVDNAAYEQKPAWETWYRVTAGVDLIVTVEDPGVGDGSGITNYVVYSEQIFTCRPDPDEEGKWVVFRQQDRPFINKKSSGTESSSWGEVKSLFKEKGAGKAGTDESSWGGIKELFR